MNSTRRSDDDAGVIEVDCLICGAGPVGLAMAVELGAQAVSCMVLDWRTTPSPQPRAKMANVRTMELMRRWGLADEVRRRAPLPPDYPNDIVFATRMLGFELARFEAVFNTVLEPDGPFPEPAQQVPQYVLEQALRDRVKMLTSVDPVFGWRLVDFEQDEESVTATLAEEATGKTKSVRTPWLIGADGARSTVRRLSQIEMEGVPGIAKNLGLVLRAPDLSDRHRLGRAIHYWLVNGDAPAVMGPLDGEDLWFFQATGFPLDQDLAAVDVEALLRGAIGSEFEHEVVAADPWTASALVASRYRDGRAFLIGDAAHLHPPMGGFGMNMGIGDALDLGWKLAAVIRGWADEAILDAYELERRPVHRRVVDEAVSNYALIGGDLVVEGLEDEGPAGDAARRAVGQRIEAEKEKEFRSLGVQLGYNYEDSPIVVADGTPWPPAAVSSYRPTARPGHRAPHLWLGPDESLYDRLGGGFCLLALTADHDLDRWRQAAAERSLPLETVVVADPEARALYGADLALIRPDLHVAWRGGAEADPAPVLDTARGARRQVEASR